MYLQGKRVTVISRHGDEVAIVSVGEHGPSTSVHVSELKKHREPPPPPFSPPPLPPSAHSSSAQLQPPIQSANAAGNLIPGMQVERRIDGEFFSCTVRSIDVEQDTLDIWYEDTQTFEERVPISEVRYLGLSQCTLEQGLHSKMGNSSLNSRPDWLKESYTTVEEADMLIAQVENGETCNSPTHITGISQTETENVEPISLYKKGSKTRANDDISSDAAAAILHDSEKAVPAEHNEKVPEVPAKWRDNLKQLEDMGFPTPVAKISLQKSGGDLQEATMFCLESLNSKSLSNDNIRQSTSPTDALQEICGTHKMLNSDKFSGHAVEGAKDKEPPVNDSSKPFDEVESVKNSSKLGTLKNYFRSLDDTCLPAAWLASYYSIVAGTSNRISVKRAHLRRVQLHRSPASRPFLDWCSSRAKAVHGGDANTVSVRMTNIERKRANSFLQLPAAMRSHSTILPADQPIIRSLDADLNVHKKIDVFQEAGILQLRPYADRCEVCSKFTQYRCRRCDEAFFCSRDCQNNGWRQHKKQCISIENLLATADSQTVARVKMRHSQRLCLARYLFPKTKADAENEKVYELMQLGSFGRSVCIKALQKHNWDSEKAANHLFVLGDAGLSDEENTGSQEKSGNTSEDESGSEDVLGPLYQMEERQNQSQTSKLKMTENPMGRLSAKGKKNRSAPLTSKGLNRMPKVFDTMKTNNGNVCKQKSIQSVNEKAVLKRSSSNYQCNSDRVEFASKVDGTPVSVTAEWLHPAVTTADFGIVVSVRETVPVDKSDSLLPTPPAINGDRSGGMVVDPWNCYGEFCPTETESGECMYQCYAWVQNLKVTELTLEWVWKQVHRASLGKAKWLKTPTQLHKCAECVLMAMSGPTILKDNSGKVVKSDKCGHRTFVMEEVLENDIKAGLLAARVEQSKLLDKATSRASLSLIYTEDEGDENHLRRESMGEEKHTEVSSSQIKEKSNKVDDGAPLTVEQSKAIEIVKTLVGDSRNDQQRAIDLLRSNGFDAQTTLGIWFAQSEDENLF